MSESTPLQKDSKNRLPKPHGIKGRIYPIRLFLNVWVKKPTKNTSPKNQVKASAGLTSSPFSAASTRDSRRPG
jgi:hypothetical protein